MIRPAKRKSSTEAGWVTQPPPGDSTIPPVRLSSRESAASSARKCSSPNSRKISRTDFPYRRSISASKSRNGLRKTLAAPRPTVVFPTPGRPTRIRCRGKGLASCSGTERRDVAVEIPARLLERIAPKLLEQGVGNDECCHGFGDYPHRRNGGDITSFRLRRRRLP